MSDNSLIAAPEQVETAGQDNASGLGLSESQTEQPRTEETGSETTPSVEATNEAEENQLLKSLPVANLYGGISHQSLQRTVSHRDIADPNLSATSSAYAAPEYFRLGCAPIWKTWESPNLRYRPLYFEDENLERYGHHYSRIQPLVSGARFFGGVVTLPYKVGARPPHDCEYGLGYYRPGNCNPAHRMAIERSVKGLALQALTVSGIITAL